MGREVRMVPAGWEHPKQANGLYLPLFKGSDYAKDKERWDNYNPEEYYGWSRKRAVREGYIAKPRLEDYMPNWNPEEATHLMMYETVSEGTPISPAFATPEELAKWLAKNSASAFGELTATYEQWLGMIRAGWAPSATIVNNSLVSGVSVIADRE